jgi:hypothetical protein
VDRVTTDRPRKIEALWHFHPHCTVEADETSVASTDADMGNLRILPVGYSNWDVEIIHGQE